MAAKIEQRVDVHDIAKLFPMMSEDEYGELKSDIQKHGLREPIWLFEGRILDGRNRYRACVEVGEPPRYRYYTEGADTLIDFVISQNLHRRHLTASQRAMLAVEIERELAKQAKERQREAGKVKAILPQAIKGQARDKAAKTTGVSPRYVSDAKSVAAKAPEVAERVKTGKMEMTDAKAIAALNEGQQKAALTILDRGHVSSGREAAAAVLTHAPNNPQELERVANLPAIPKREAGEGEKWSKNLTDLSRKVMSVYVNGGLKVSAAKWSKELLAVNYESVCQILQQLTTWKEELEEVMLEKGVKHES